MIFLLGKNKNVIIVDKAVGCCEGYGELAICEAEHTISTMSDKWIDEGRLSFFETCTRVGKL